MVAQPHALRGLSGVPSASPSLRVATPFQPGALSHVRTPVAPVSQRVAAVPTVRSLHAPVAVTEPPPALLEDTSANQDLVTTNQWPFSSQSQAQSSEASFRTSISNSSYLHKDHNSVTVKADTPVKDAAGAIVKVLNRSLSTLVTALQVEASHESVNRAVKALAVARKYLQDQGEPRTELGFFPLNRCSNPHLFGFLAFKSQLASGVVLDTSTDLHVSSNSDPQAMAATIIRKLRERGQAVLKAGGSSALRVAMAAVIEARRQLKAVGSDVLLVPQWITHDTRETLGRESKFLSFTILPSLIAGAVLPAAAQAGLTPLIIPISPQNLNVACA
mmetsp:Transcript_15622/g.27020  ORF Transcript_15622/g.27020 Transcript_15622/m.27020 type:complete len:332 (-) Transcript_15622:1152-2147(-)|eukprot:CAMPEP_0119104426 /NCGR_PEP_ID=MMETSP1180-20130426/2644_1 /TAXON_ID=3052 ORGANISM="Chlamydomonas cf sp, Strain CCMP681" /NCGR_SAMPLE_ID=MMETSP1180 /ASSEMBLY_ACC=CAM_ASM_000741 /LENGTH=331 /DNA_ID=CAMNT_0007089183 /DNA_START=93 /DNA_END=1088 /DNA_ORIENTATION=-